MFGGNTQPKLTPLAARTAWAPAIPAAAQGAGRYVEAEYPDNTYAGYLAGPTSITALRLGRGLRSLKHCGRADQTLDRLAPVCRERRQLDRRFSDEVSLADCISCGQLSHSAPVQSRSASDTLRRTGHDRDLILQTLNSQCSWDFVRLIHAASRRYRVTRR